MEILLEKLLFQDFSQTYDRIADGSSKRDVEYKWKNFKDTADNQDNKLGMTYLRSLYNKIENKKKNQTHFTNLL
jgi:hypothetical protein